MESKNWIYPPWLKIIEKEFISLSELLCGGNEKTPLLICGETGSGKSAFTDIFKQRFLKKKQDLKVVTVNIAAIPEQLIESALFGHIKGAFTGATKTKKGFVDNANLLILEEIGELPSFIQAKLLTFIEDGIYYPVGATEPKEAGELQIVATTNKQQKDFRPDFYARFYRFNIPALYQRRTDVLHYFRYFAPETFQKLHPWEIMALVCHHWPANVRELKTFAKEIELAKIRKSKLAYKSWRSDFHDAMISTITNIENRCDSFRRSLELNGVDVMFLEKALNTYGLGLDYRSQKTPLKDSDPENFGALIQIGIEFFCSLFFKDLYSSHNLLADRTDNLPRDIPYGPRWPDLNQKKLRKLAADCLRYIGIRLKGELPDPEAGRAAFFEAIGVHNPDPIPAPETKAAGEEKTLQTRDECLRSYYTGLLNYTGGNVSEATRISGDDKRTMYKYLKKYGLK